MLVRAILVKLGGLGDKQKQKSYEMLFT